MSTATLVDRSRLQTLLGGYSAGFADSLSDLSFQVRAQEARRRLAARMVAVDRSGIQRKMPDGEFFVSRKVDGEFTIVVCNGSEAILVNPGGTVRCGLPVLEEICGQLGRAGIRQAILAGELYVRRTDRRPRVHDVARVARTPESASDLETLCFAAFDLVEVDGKPAPEQYGEVFTLLEKAFGHGDRVHPVETWRTRSRAEIEKLFDDVVTVGGAEGLVARNDEAGLFKIKPRHNLDVAIIGFTEGQDDREGMLHDMLVAVMRQEGLLQVLGRVGGGFTEEERRNWLSDLKDEVTRSDYAEVNDQIAYQLVRPERVIEISCLDLIDQNTRGATIDRMVLRYDSPESTYRTVRRLPLCAPISPQFIRAREDKSVNPLDVRIRQVTDLIEVPSAERDAASLVLPHSEVLHRAVYRKTLKGQTLVRKLMLWKTNKELIEPDYPAFVAYVTDFSPGREEALKRDIRVSNSPEQINALLQELTAQYVVRGWEAVG
ncbi:MAG: ATP-dependent ligase [Armatimonadetes bacterium]|jgi:hypothetical protein|nr:ATP-dependent ligase [Armatimonadota bacterium]